MAKKIFGPNIVTLKGKLMQSKATPADFEIIKIPTEIKLQVGDLKMAMDTVFICRSMFLTTTDVKIKFCAILGLQD